MRVNQASQLSFVIGTRRRRVIDTQSPRQFSQRGQSLAGLQPTTTDIFSNQFSDQTISWLADLLV